MNQFLGILGLAGFAIVIIGAAAASTLGIVKLFPAPEDREAMRLDEERNETGAPPVAS